MVVDALDLCYTKGHVDTFAIISGDSDFSPLVSKLRENAKTVIGIGVKNSTSDLFLNNCDEFIYYDDLVRKERSRRRSVPAASTANAANASNSGNPASQPNAGVAPNALNSPNALNAPNSTNGAHPVNAPSKPASAESKGGPDATEALDLVVETLEAVTEERGENEPIWGSMIKQAIKRRHPGFNERFYGFRSFNDLLADAEKRGLLTLRADEKSGGYTVRMAEKPPLSKA
jgi:hypothetical protein